MEAPAPASPREEPPTPATPSDSTLSGVRSSVIESIRGCGLRVTGIDKEELRARLVMPKYLRIAVRNSIRFEDPERGLQKDKLNIAATGEAPESPVVVFINSRSGGRHGPELKLRLQQLIAEEQLHRPGGGGASAFPHSREA